jgi:hypothetical protein
MLILRNICNALSATPLTLASLLFYILASTITLDLAICHVIWCKSRLQNVEKWPNENTENYTFFSYSIINAKDSNKN